MACQLDGSARSTSRTLNPKPILQGLLQVYSLFLLIAFQPSWAWCATQDQIRTSNLPGRVTLTKNDVFHQTVDTTEHIAQVGQWVFCGEGLRTALGAMAKVELANRSPVRLWDRTRLQIVCDPVFTNIPVVRVLGGQTYVINRGPTNAPLRLEAPMASAVPKGTEFLVRVDPVTGQTEFAMFDGELAITTARTNALLHSGQQGIVSPDSVLTIRPVLEATNIVQWWIYYPAVLDADELGLTPAENEVLAQSLAAYRSGDLQQALHSFPDSPNPPEPPTDAQRIYLGALMLAIGAVDRTEAMLAKSDPNTPPARALRTMIAAVQSPTGDVSSRVDSSAEKRAAVEHVPSTASELLALSYVHQARHDLKSALAVARAASAVLPDHSARLSSNGFAWARVAELEFSFGHTSAAQEALERALELSPRNAQAHAVHGYLLAAEYKFHQAVAAFDEAIELDPMLGSAWLGRGLCKRRLGSLTPLAKHNTQAANPSDWLSDIQTAATLEPRRSLYRSYTGKAFADSGDFRLAHKELDVAKHLDPADPTPWLYSALTLWEQHRVNEAITNLEHSIDLNDNRAVYRSRLLLDQDQAVRSASLAKIYRDAGLENVALSEASRAVSYDYANHSAHQFLAESYDALRDPTRFNLRYETVWFNELLLANLLSPVGAGLLSQTISQQEYSPLFERDRLGLSTSTEVRSDGQYRTVASQSGQWGRSAYTLDLDYQHNNGVRPNNDLDRIEWYSQFKHQLNARDSIFLLTKYQDYESGDNFQHYDPANASRTFRVTESQAPIVLAGTHREWAPGVHSTLLLSRLDDKLDQSGVATIIDVRTNLDGSVHSLAQRSFTDATLYNRFTAWGGELNQILQGERTTVITGLRGQAGALAAESRLASPSSTVRFPVPVTNHFDTSVDRISAYAYLTRELWERLRLTTGVTYDHASYPDGFRSAPVSESALSRNILSPKAGLTWDVRTNLTARALYAQALGGVSFDESVRLEPTQLAGFSQGFRSVISEAEAGSVIAPRHELGALALDWRIWASCYFGVGGQWLQSDAEQQLGVFTGRPSLSAAFPSHTPERLDYRERSLSAYWDQLLGPEWSLGTSYRLTESRLDRSYPDIPSTVDWVSVPPRSPGPLSRSERALLHEITARIGFASLSGFFARAQARWFVQDNAGYPDVFSDSRPGDSVCHIDLQAGWRFARRRSEILLGCLNITGQSYRFNSLTPYPDLPRDRIWVGRFRCSF